MKPLIIVLAAISLFFSEMFGQDSARIFMNKNYEAVENPADAFIIRDALVKEGRYYISDQYADGRKILKGEYSSVDPWTEDGPFVFYDVKGSKYAEGSFSNGVMNGQWIYYDSTGNDTVAYQKEWFDIVNSNDIIRYDGEIDKMNEKLNDYITSNTHYPPRLIMDCISRSDMFRVLISKEKEIKIMSEVPNDFKIEIYRIFRDLPDSFLHNDKKRKNLYFYRTFNFLCTSASITGSAELADCNQPVFVFVEEQAIFQGGTLENFREWVQGNLVYPAEAVEGGESGRITVQFIVTSNGKVGCIKMLRSTGFPALDYEAIRVIGESPVWVPAKQDGKAVNQQFVMPVIFQIR